MVSCNVQRIYDEYVARLSAVERLRLVELITRGMAQPDPPKEEPAAVAVAAQSLNNMPGWQPGERRSAMNEWRDRAL
jgi:hypothetical protein